MSRPVSRSQKRREAIQKSKPVPDFSKPDEAELNDEYAADAARGVNLVPVLGMAEEALVYALGAEKYGANSWREGMPWSICVIKMQRHLGKWLAGESRCPEDGQHHLASVKFWCNALMEFEHTHITLNNVTK